MRVHATLIKSGASPNVLVGEPPRLSPLFLAWAQDEGSHEMNCLLGVRRGPRLGPPTPPSSCRAPSPFRWARSASAHPAWALLHGHVRLLQLLARAGQY